jgi:nitrite reductase/ring-hydroxylating ferredoxin subunit
MATQLDPARPATMNASPAARIIEPIEEQPWLDRLGDGLMSLLGPLLERPGALAIKDILHGRWLGHALHPVLSDAPIGLWMGALVADAADQDTAAGVLSAAGSTAALATAASGLADWTGTHGRERRLALMHGLINSAGLGLQLASLALRVGGRRRPAVALSALGFGVSSAAAYLGGELVFDRGVMVNHDAWTAGPQDWTPVLASAELAERQHRKVEVDGRAVLLYREDGQVHALENACTHAGGPLDEGEVQDGVVTCPWHGSQFRLTTGVVCRGPATFPQLRLQAREAGGQIEVRGRQG